ncbi:MAG TPA: VOC family protein [Mobilitalea sp.]|nr:VOC family protein [Mobilitalea sp.]
MLYNEKGLKHMVFVGICLVTDNVPALVMFYEELLNMKAQGDEIHSEFVLEGGSFAIYSRQAAKEDMSLNFDSEASNFTLTFLVEDVELEYERLKKLGVEILNAPRTYSWGARSMQFKDIDGNVISFACRGK